MCVPEKSQVQESSFGVTTSSGVFVIIVKVDAKQEVLQVRLVASVHKLGHHWGTQEKTMKNMIFSILS